MSSYDIWLALYGLFHLHIFKVYPSRDTYQNFILLVVYNYILFIHSLSMDICFPWLLWIMLLWTRRYLFETQFSILLGSYQKWNWWELIWSYGNSMFNFFWGTALIFSSVTGPFYILPAMHEGSNLYPCSHLVFSVFIFF